MADDWIKMRTDLYRDPKVCAMADILMDEDGELGRFVNQNMQRNMTVTRNVTRNACVGALLSVWGVFRHRGRNVSDDLCCSGVTVSVIDDIADLPGFGEAMEAVGWVVQTEAGITFPRFFSEFNADPANKTKSNAAVKQARYRARKEASQGVTLEVTKCVTPTVTETVTKGNALRNVTPREEKRREEDTASAVSVCDTKPKRTQSRGFVAPTVEEVRAYCIERGNAVDPERFVDHYAARGWVMSNGRKVKDWQACVRTWEKNDEERRGNGNAVAVRPTGGNRPVGGFATREQQREAANHDAIAAFLHEAGVREGDAGADDAQAHVGLHQTTAKRLVLRSEAVPGQDDQSGGRGASNVGDAISGGRRPIPPVSPENTSTLFPDGGG